MDHSDKNPWLAIWTDPRPTIRHIVNTDPKRGFYWLATLYSLQSLLFIANYISLGLSYHLAMILVLSMVLSPLLGTIWLYFYGWLFYFTGKWLGGKAPQSFVRAAFAWSKVPLLINLAMWFLLLLFSAGHAFVQYSSGPSLIFIHLITLISGVWSFILLIQCLREVQGFSIGRSLGNAFLGYGIGFIIFFAISLLISLIIGAK